ncbi:hypothetical protein [Streptomyces sp. NPDC053728]|uniref:ATP-dependent DNA ligase n=1 Tax=Streptomyces sp. NPDC053728 TaxID=3155534 RepID=UPI0034316194
MVLRPPVEPMLAQARETLPPLGTGGVAVQPKFDGFRALLYTPLRHGDPVLLQTRRGALAQDRFPDLAAAPRSLPNGLVLDGELAVLDHHGQLSFTALQRRATAGRNARVLAAAMPAHFIAFDVLQSDGQELLDEPFAPRREVLELFTSYRLTPPWTLCPSTTDPAIADEWLHEWTDVPGVEGVVAKSRTLPARRARLDQGPPQDYHRSTHRSDRRLLAPPSGPCCLPYAVVGAVLGGAHMLGCEAAAPIPRWWTAPATRRCQGGVDMGGSVSRRFR